MISIIRKSNVADLNQGLNTKFPEGKSFNNYENLLEGLSDDDDNFTHRMLGSLSPYVYLVIRTTKTNRVMFLNDKDLALFKTIKPVRELTGSFLIVETLKSLLVEKCKNCVPVMQSTVLVPTGLIKNVSLFGYLYTLIIPDNAESYFKTTDFYANYSEFIDISVIPQHKLSMGAQTIRPTIIRVEKT